MGRVLSRKRRQSGASVIEFSMLLPWVMFLFVGAFDWGIYAHALISTENAARVAALYGANLCTGCSATSGTGTVSTATACTLVLQELSVSPNVAGLTGCTGPITDSQPVMVAVSCPSALDSVNSVRVAVTYRTVQLIPIPGLLMGKATLYRTAQLPMKNNLSCATS